MKIIRFFDSDPHSVSDVDFHPDSALLLPGRPMFYPDFGGQWIAMPYMAVHVNRLGKSIGMKFASRYYDSVSVGLRFAPADPEAISPGGLSGMDATVTHGEWIPLAQWQSLQPVKCMGVNSSGNELWTIELEMAGEVAKVIDSAIVHVSELTTLRMGDILLLPLTGTHDMELSPRTRVAATGVDGKEILNVKVV